MNLSRRIPHFVPLTLASALFASLIIGLVAAQPASAQSAPVNGSIHYGGDPCRDAQGHEICTHFMRPDGRINNSDPLETIVGYCQADHSIQVYGVYSGVGQYLATASPSDIVDGLQTAIQTNIPQIIVDVKGMQMIGLPSGQLELADHQTGSGYTFTFSPTVCGLPATVGNPASAATAVATGSAALAPTLLAIPPVSTSDTQIQNTIRIYLRSGPGNAFTHLALIPRGSVLTLVAKVPMQNGVQWIKVQYGTQTGWIIAYYTNISVRVLRNLPIDPTAASGVQPTPTLPAVG